MEAERISRTEPRWERRKEARPQELMDAALALFAEKGFAATRLDDVAHKAGVSKGTLYLYFDSKEELFKAVVRSGIVPAILEAERLVDDFTGTASALVEQIVRGWWQLIVTTHLSAVPKIMIAEARNFPELASFYHDEVISRGKAMLVRALQRGVGSGEFRPIDVEAAVHIVMAPLVMRAVSQHSLDCIHREPVEPEAYFRTYLEFVLRSLRRETSPC
jgi:AcrR family transcriptional regulator